MTWQTVKLGDVCEINPRFTGQLGQDATVSFVPMAAVSEVSGSITNEKSLSLSAVKNGLTPFKNEDILFAKITPCFENGKIAQANISNEWDFGSTEFHVVRPNPQAAGNYLLHLLRAPAVREEGAKQMTGSAGQKRVPKHYLANLEIPLPPLVEQKRLAAILDRADAMRRLRRESLARLDELAQSLFLELFGDPVGNPQNWPMCKVGSLCNLVRGSSPRPRADPRYYDGPVPRLMVADLTRDGFLVTPRIDSLTEAGAKLSRPVKAGTVVMAVSGNVGLVSQLAIDACIHDGFVGFTKLDTKIVNPMFFMLILHHLKMTHENRKAGAIFQNLTTTDIKTMQIPLPPLELQQQFAEQIAELEAIKSRARASLLELDALFASLQARAFAGELSGAA